MKPEDPKKNAFGMDTSAVARVEGLTCFVKQKQGLFVPWWSVCILCGLLLIGMLAMGLGYQHNVSQAEYVYQLQLDLITERQLNAALSTLLLHYSEVDPNFQEKWDAIICRPIIDR